MTIGLIDVDGHNFPNFALMKISAYHKSKGDHVEWAQPVTLFEQVHYDRIYASKVFTFTPDADYTQYLCDDLQKGGTGYDIKSKLPPPSRIADSWTTPSTRGVRSAFSSSAEAASATVRSASSATRKVTSAPSHRTNSTRMDSG